MHIAVKYTCLRNIVTVMSECRCTQFTKHVWFNVSSYKSTKQFHDRINSLIRMIWAHTTSTKQLKWTVKAMSVMASTLTLSTIVLLLFGTVLTVQYSFLKFLHMYLKPWWLCINQWFLNMSSKNYIFDKRHWLQQKQVRM
jgi:hypothetical protein